jgi:hypothetical protein
LQENKNIYYLLFHTIHDVLKTEKLLKAHGCIFELVPVPRNLSSDCGSCIMLKSNIDDVLKQINKIEIDRCFLFDGKNYTTFIAPSGHIS